MKETKGSRKFEAKHPGLRQKSKKIQALYKRIAGRGRIRLIIRYDIWYNQYNQYLQEEMFVSELKFWNTPHLREDLYFRIKP